MGSVVLRAGGRRTLAIFAAIAAALAAAALAPPASAQFPSPNCEGAREGVFNGLYGGQTNVAFGASEVLKVVAQEPTKGPQPDLVTLQINGKDFFTFPFEGPDPAVVILFDPNGHVTGGYTASWFVSSGGQRDTEATWSVNCRLELGSPPPPKPTSKKQCKHGDWKLFGTMFKNQGDCVSFVATGGKNRPAGRSTRRMQLR